MLHLSTLNRRALFAALIAASFVVALPQVGQAQVVAFKQAVAEAASRDDGIAAFYRGRNFEPIWTGDSPQDLARREILLEALTMAGAHGLPVARYNADVLVAMMGNARTSRERGEVEVALSRAFIAYAHDIQSGILTPGKIVSGIKREVPLRDPVVTLTSITRGDPRTVMRALAPTSQEYVRLMKEKLLLERKAGQGGWGPEVIADKLEQGQSGAAVVALRNRLISMGYISRSASASFDAELRTAVMQFQTDHGLTADGVAGQNTLGEVNVSVVERLQSILVAMERERWMNLPEGLGKRHINVNLTDFTAQIIDDGKVTFETRAVVGAVPEDRETPEFSDVMEFMMVNPSWYVPRSIVVKEYLPKLRNDPGAVGHLQITDSSGRQVDRATGFAQYSASSFPFSMRQPPGPSNALGEVKFMFPNKYNIYLHDTPSKSLFEREVRAFSHGCIRLADPRDFAVALLAAQTSDPEGLFLSRLRTGKESRINLETPVPVHLIYRTAFTSAKGKTSYRRDIYGRDARIWSALSEAGVALPTQGS
ncbi:L,D-transpeptidase family protein [Puniceibacterium sediminis]|uniref:Murein L,D-transpeptidase YcbB/YkuD n=1 Tax=Puniceibacterium sediminis TaxID=1608407 RepID=A0A238YI38_9RHOB|nr:L,D-transpeptidase family protein [Puniceibacterium sediminis]SNR70381.1 Murein L,D-transpeptidase YcbB/YkuD [Puniceibacterium sediminis]